MLRSVDGGANWSVLDDLHFPRAPVFELAFHNGELRAATFGRGVFSFVKPKGPVHRRRSSRQSCVRIVCAGSRQYLTIDVYNVGVADLVVDSVAQLMGSAGFAVLPNPGRLSFSLRARTSYSLLLSRPPARRLDIATIRIITQRPDAPVVDLLAIGCSGRAGSLRPSPIPAASETSVSARSPTSCSRSTTPGPAHCWSPASPGPRISSRRACSPTPFTSARATRSTSSSAFSRRPPSVPKAGAITISSNDPAGSHVVPVSGDVPAPKAGLIIADSGKLRRRLRRFVRRRTADRDEQRQVRPQHHRISSSAPDFLAPEALSYPITVGPGDDLPVPIRFKPLGLGSKTATITVTSDDPASPISVNVSGDAPPGRLTVTGSTTFGGLTAGCCADRTLWIANTGECALDVTSRALQTQEPALAFAQQSVPGQAAPRRQPSGRHSILRRRKMPSPMRAGDRERRPRDAGQVRRGAGLHDLGARLQRGV